MDRNSIIALFLFYRQRKRRRNRLHWGHPVIQTREEFGVFYTLFGQLGDGAHRFFLKIIFECLFHLSTRCIAVDIGSYGKDCDSTIFKRSTLLTSIQTNILKLPSERLLSGTEGPTVPYLFVGGEGFALNRNILRTFGGFKLMSVKKERTTIACAEHEGMWNVLLEF
jgi:hypothetical protein